MRKHNSRAARPVLSTDVLQRLVEDAPDVIFRVRLKPAPRLDYVNRAVLDLTGYSDEDWYRDRSLLSRVVTPNDRKQLATIARTGRLPARPILLHFVHADGRELTAEARCAAVRDRRGETVAIQGCVHEVFLQEPVAASQPVQEPEAPPPKPMALQYSGIEVDTDRMQVKFEGNLVPLTLKEVLLLAYLIRHRGEMLRRDRVLDDVWGPGHSSHTRTLDVHVCRLRRKLPPLAGALATVGHFGYTLQEQMAREEISGT